MRRRSLLGRQTAAPPAGLVTDLVSGFIHGYSQARKLRNAYGGNCLGMRRSSDNAASNIGFVSDALDETALTTFVGANDGFLVTLIDQVGLRNIVQTSSLTRQPQIVTAGTVVKVSGKPYAQYDGIDDYLITSSATPITDLDCTVFVVFESQAADSNQPFLGEVQTAGARLYTLASDTRATPNRHSIYKAAGTNVFLNFPSQQPQSTKRCLIFRRSGTTIEAYDESGFVDSTTATETFSADTVLEMGRAVFGGDFFSGKIAELLINNTALSTTDRNTVLDNIKDFYSIV